MSAGFFFRKPTEADIAYVAEHMREADRREMKRWTAQEADYELKQSVKLSDVCYTGCFDDGSIACIFGACRANLIDSSAVLWSLSTTDVDKHPIAFWKGTKAGLDRIFREMSDVCDFCNYVDLDYEAAVRWISRFGGEFSLTAPRRPGIRGGVFGQFYIMNPYFKED